MLQSKFVYKYINLSAEAAQVPVMVELRDM